MAGHPHAGFLADRDDSVQEIPEVFPQVVRPDGFILLQRGFKQRQAFRLPAGKAETAASFRGSLHDFQRPHGAEILLVKIKAVASVLGDDAGEICPQPVENRHEIVYDYFHAVLCQHPDRGDIVFDIFIPPGNAKLDIFMDVNGFDDFDLKAGVIDFLFQRRKFLLRPVHTGRLFQQAHQACHSGNLLYIFQGNRIRCAAVPAKSHFHQINTPIQ